MELARKGKEAIKIWGNYITRKPTLSKKKVCEWKSILGLLNLNQQIAAPKEDKLYRFVPSSSYVTWKENHPEGRAIE